MQQHKIITLCGRRAFLNAVSRATQQAHYELSQVDCTSRSEQVDYWVLTTVCGRPASCFVYYTLLVTCSLNLIDRVWWPVAKETSVGTDLYPHTPILRPHAARYSTSGTSLSWRLRWHMSKIMFTCRWAWPARSPIRPILGLWGRNVSTNGDSLPWMPMNCRAIFDAASITNLFWCNSHFHIPK